MTLPVMVSKFILIVHLIYRSTAQGLTLYTGDATKEAFDHSGFPSTIWSEETKAFSCVETAV